MATRRKLNTGIWIRLALFESRKHDSESTAVSCQPHVAFVFSVVGGRTSGPAGSARAVVLRRPGVAKGTSVPDNVQA